MNILGIDLGSTQTCAILAQKDEDGHLNIIGSGKARTQGVKKGAITNIELASKSISQAAKEAQIVAGVSYDKVIVSVSGAYAKSVNSVGVVNIPGSEITIKEIHRAVSTAKHTANIPNGYRVIHVLPYNFKVNDIDNIDDPLGMSGNRLEVLTHIIISQEVHIKNLEKAIGLADLRVDNLVLSGYASSIACLDDSEKELGAILIDMGGAICDIVMHMGNSLRYNDCLLIGSTNITQDLAVSLHTPLKEAEKIKLNYANLSQEPENLVKVPFIGDERKINDVKLEIISNVIYARAEETLMILAKMLSENPYANSAGAGIVLTGGMTKLARIDELSYAMFDNKSVRLACVSSDKIFGFSDVIADPENACAIGLCLYGAGYFTPYELDSKDKLRYKGEPELVNKSVQNSLAFEEEEGEIKNENYTENSQENDTIKLRQNLDLLGANKDKKDNLFSKVWNKIMNQF